MTLDGTGNALATSSTSPRAQAVASGTAASTARRIARAPALWLGVLVGLSTVVRAVIGLRVPSPWILPDEIVYSELAKSIAEGQPAVDPRRARVRLGRGLPDADRTRLGDLRRPGAGRITRHS